jgi:hypothetical protein
MAAVRIYPIFSDGGDENLPALGLKSLEGISITLCLITYSNGN